MNLVDGRRDLGFFQGENCGYACLSRETLSLKMNLHRDCPLRVFSSQGSQFRVDEGEALCRVGDGSLQSLPHSIVPRNVNDASILKTSYLWCKSFTFCSAVCIILHAFILKTSILCQSLTPMKKHARFSKCLYNPNT